MLDLNCLKGKAQDERLRIPNPEPQLLKLKPRRFRSELSANPIGVFATLNRPRTSSAAAHGSTSYASAEET